LLRGLACRVNRLKLFSDIRAILDFYVLVRFVVVQTPAGLRADPGLAG
jgi:hypothetical protein